MQTYRICDGVFGGHARLCNGCRLLITHKAIYVGICTMHSACAPAHHPMCVRKHTHTHTDDAEACSSVFLYTTKLWQHFMRSYWDWQMCLREPQTPLTIFKLVALLIWLIQQQQQQHIKRYVRSRTHATRHILIWNAERTASLAPRVVNQKKTQARPHNPWQSTLPNSRSYIAAYMYSEQSHVLGANCERHFGC